MSDNETAALLGRALGNLRRTQELMETRMQGVLVSMSDMYSGVDEAIRLVVEALGSLEIRAAEPEKLTLVRAEQTCYGCPSSWDAWDAAGILYTLRYRWGCGQVMQKQRLEDGELREMVHGIEVASFEVPEDHFGGVMDLAEFAERAGIELGGGVS